MELKYNCKLCKMHFSNHYELNGHNTKHRKTTKHINYELNPKKCEECNDDIKWKSYMRNKSIRFCSVSCRAKFYYKYEEKCVTKNK